MFVFKAAVGGAGPIGSGIAQTIADAELGLATTVVPAFLGKRSPRFRGK